MNPFTVPLYLTPPSTEPIRAQIRAGTLGAITTPAQGTRLREDWWWAADNGAFTGAYPGDDQYLAWLKRLRPYADRCLFATAPDVVGDFHATWNRSYDMLQRIRDLGLPAAVVAQDHMEFCPYWEWEDFDAVFIGGTTSWKLSPAAANLARCARSIGLHVHMGRVNSLRRYRYAHQVTRAHSVDGTYLINAPDRLLPNVLSWRVRTLTETAAFDVGACIHDPWDGGYDAASHTPPAPPRQLPPGQPVLFELRSRPAAARPTSGSSSRAAS